MVSTHLKHSQIGLLSIYLNWPRFCGVDRHHFMGQIVQNMGHLGSRCIHIYKYIFIYVFIYLFIHMCNCVTSYFPHQHHGKDKWMWFDVICTLTSLSNNTEIIYHNHISKLPRSSSDLCPIPDSFFFHGFLRLQPPSSQRIFSPERAGLIGLIIFNSCP